MKNLEILFLALLIAPSIMFSQTIEIVSYGENPVEVSPLLGANVTINYKYTSEAGSSGNHIYIGIDVLDENDNYVATVSGATLENQTAGENREGSVALFIGSSNPLSENLSVGYYYQAKAILYASGGWSANAWAGYWNTPALTLQDTIGFAFSTNTIAKGVDVSWMTEMEAAGYTWNDNAGNTKELMPLLAEYDIDAIRLRVWVNPENSAANGWCDIEDLVTKAELANALNMDIMICIHYSDHWADPGQQTKPADWSGFSVAQLETAVANHTTEILTALNAVGITPKWVQIGNETNDGMLWNTGKASAGGFGNYAKFLNAGSNAVKTFNNTIKTILHLSNGDDNGLYRWNIDGALNNGLLFDKFDIIGMSLYPDESNWLSKVDDTYSNMLNLKSLYNKDVMMVEVGFSNGRPDISQQFLIYMIEKTRQAEGLGVFYWEPIGHGDFTSYSKGAWDADGSPSIAMDAFLNETTLDTEDVQITNSNLFKIYPNPSSKTITIHSKNQVLNTLKMFDINGRLLINISANSLSKTINISDLDHGIYILQINNNQALKCIKN